MENNQRKNEEILYMNVAKALGICLIVIGHSFTEDSSSTIRSFVYLFHVPLFFMISGYFFKEDYLRTPGRLIFRRIKSLWVPFFSWSLLFILLHNLFFVLHIYSTEVTFRGSSVLYNSSATTIKNISYLFLFRTSEQLLAGFWFISSLFFTVIIFLTYNLITKKINNHYKLFIMSSIGFVLGVLLYKFELRIPFIPYDIRLPLVTTFLYFIGFTYKKYENFVPIRVWLVLVSILLLSIVNAADFVKIDSIFNVVGSLRRSVLYLIVTPVLGAYIIISFSKYIANYSISNILNIIGSKTMTILALHFLCFKVVNFIIVYKNGFNYSDIAQFPVIPDQESWFMAYSIAGICIPILLHLLFSKTKDVIMQVYKI